MPFKELPGLRRPLYAEGEDGSGLHSIYLRRGAGYYIDVDVPATMLERMSTASSKSKKSLKKSFFSPDHGSELSRELAKEFLRQAGVTNVGQVSADPQVNPIREILRPSLNRRSKKSALGSRAVKRLARK